MIKAMILSGMIYGGHADSSPHYVYARQIDPDNVRQVTMLRPASELTIERRTEIKTLRREREIARRKARAEANKRRQAAIQRQAKRENLILAGLVSVVRDQMTAPIDGCSKTQKGLIMSGGFMVFTCEKLLPSHAISHHEAAFLRYRRSLLEDGWRLLPESQKHDLRFSRSDGLGCEPKLELKLWTDRSMNEPRRPASERNAHRQIVFMAKFMNAKCDRYFPIAEALASQ